jgi:hypothetical protein
MKTDIAASKQSDGRGNSCVTVCRCKEIIAPQDVDIKVSWLRLLECDTVLFGTCPLNCIKDGEFFYLTAQL